MPRIATPFFAALCAVLVLGAPAGAQELAASTADPDPAAELDAVRTATERFRDVEVALAEGYVPDPSGMCITAEMEGWPRQMGAMGLHYFRPDLLGITGTDPVVTGTGTHTDFREPGVLVYLPTGDGELELVAVENLVFADAWHAAGHAGPPEFLGNEYFRLVENPETEILEAHGFAPHYELHVWVHRENPAGTFMPFNPDMRCPASGTTMHETAATADH